MPVVFADVFGRFQRVVDEDGSERRIDDGRFMVFSPSGDLIVDRELLNADVEALLAEVADFEAALNSVMNLPAAARANDRFIRVSYDSGASERIDFATGRYQRRDEDGRRILDRSGDERDEARLRSIADGLDEAGARGVEREGGAGDDALSGTARRDSLEGGGGGDALRGRGGDDFAVGGAGDDLIAGGAGGDYLYGEEDDDTIRGGGGDDHLDGGAGMDMLSGGAGADTLDGGFGADTIRGGAGDDRIFGDSGDRLEGGAGRDSFNFSAASTGPGEAVVEDFTPGEDVIDLAPFIDADFFLAAARFTQDGDDAVIDFGFGFSIRLEGVRVQDLNETDFVLQNGDAVLPF